MIKTIYIVGPAEAGKSSFARLLSESLARVTKRAWLVADTSAPLFRWLAEIQAAGPWPGPEYRSVEKWEAYLRSNVNLYRPMLVKVGDCQRVVDPGSLVKQAKARGSIVTGVRRSLEVHAEQWSADLGVTPAVFVYIEKPGQCVRAAGDNFDADYFLSIAHHTISNRGGDLGSLAHQAEMLAAKILKESA